MKTKNIIYYSVVFVIAIVSKTAYAFATNDSLLFMLRPLSNAVSLITGTTFQYTNDFGFYFENLNITIDKSCSGINFWVISFVVFIVPVLKVCKSHLQKTIAFPIVLFATYILTLFANTSRILTSIVISKQTDFNYSWLHQAEGVFIYLSFLILVYTILNSSLSKFNSPHEKLT